MLPCTRPQHMIWDFFAAITIECDEVILDLNGYCIQQSMEHNIRQRFFSIIECGSLPFITGQGPVPFGTYTPCNHVVIRNGTLGLSSHHGIHGNDNRDILIDTVKICDFEVAGIALNGVHGCTIQHTSVGPARRVLPINNRFSPSLHLVRVCHTIGMTAHPLAQELHTRIELFVVSLLSHNPDKQSMFYNPHAHHGPNGNIYGIVFHHHGVVTNGLLSAFPAEEEYATDILLDDVHVESICSHPEIIVPIQDPQLYKGVSGDLFNLNDFASQGPDQRWVYNGHDPFVELMCLLSKQLPVDTSETMGCKYASHLSFSLFLPPSFCHWVDSGQPSTFITGPNTMDSMGHILKGNIGLFLSGVCQFRSNNLTITNLANKTMHVGTGDISAAYGMRIVYSKEIMCRNTQITNITSANGRSTLVDTVGERSHHTIKFKHRVWPKYSLYSPTMDTQTLYWIIGCIILLVLLIWYHVFK